MRRTGVARPGLPAGLSGRQHIRQDGEGLPEIRDVDNPQLGIAAVGASCQLRTVAGVDGTQHQHELDRAVGRRHVPW